LDREAKKKEAAEKKKREESEWDYEFRHNKEWNTSKADINFNFEHPFHSIIMFCRFVRLIIYFIYCMYFNDLDGLIIHRVVIFLFIVTLILIYIIYRLYKYYIKKKTER
jgi:hypothetical protein